MKTKFYSMYGTAVDANCEEHVITVVGRYEETKEPKIDVEEISLVRDGNVEVSGNFSFVNGMKKTRTLTYAYSICHPEDEFDEELGIKIAKKRIDERPLGQLTTNMVTTLCKDQINLILFGELSYISNNLAHFLNEN